jgi:succinylglutamic semialdehyde dehydrogenase
MIRTTPHLVHGQWVAASGAALISTNPATGEVLWQGQAADEQTVADAVHAARAAFGEWGYRPLEERLAIIRAFKAELEAHQLPLAETISRETGKVLWDAKTEVAAMINKVEISIKSYHERTGQQITDANGVKSVLRHRPHGVLAVFGPYNFPGHLPNGHIVPALIAGNTIVFKPSDHTPLVAEQVLRLWQEAGLPAGVINLVQGDRETGRALANHSGIDGLLFTGSSTVGTLLHQQFAGQPQKILALEMGGNNPLVIETLEDVNAAAYHTIQSAFITSGQRCTCARRLILVENAQTDAFLARLVEMTKTIRVGAWDDTPEPFMGPLITNIEADKLLAAQSMLLEAGGKSLLEMQRTREGLPFLSPAIIDTTEVEKRPDQEWFGPLLQVIRVPDIDAAILEANRTSYGLAAAIFTKDASSYEHFQRNVRAGCVNWNRATTGASSALPFGGVGLSGNHRPSAWYAADYCAWPMASMEIDSLTLPAALSPGMSL